MTSWPPTTLTWLFSISGATDRAVSRASAIGEHIFNNDNSTINNERTVNLIVETRAHKGFFDEVLPGTGFNYSVYSYGALAAISMFQKTRRGRYKSMAKWFSKKITEAAAKGVSTIGRVYEKVDHTQHG
jgi:hypothetical protein